MASRPQQRGVGAFFQPVRPAGVEDMENAREIEVARLSPNPFQPRTEFDPDKLRELATSISRRRVLQPLLGRPHPDDPALYQIAAGEPRNSPGSKRCRASWRTWTTTPWRRSR